jgi:hypothetical protein
VWHQVFLGEDLEYFLMFLDEFFTVFAVDSVVEAFDGFFNEVDPVEI